MKGETQTTDPPLHTHHRTLITEAAAGDDAGDDACADLAARRAALISKLYGESKERSPSSAVQMVMCRW